MPSPSTPENRLRTDFIERLSRGFESIGAWSYDHRWVVLLASVAVLGLGIYFATLVRIDNGMQAWFAKEDPTFLIYEDYRDEFGSDESSYIIYEARGFEHGPWNLEVMRKIAALTEVLESEVPFVDEATSLANAELMVPADGGIDIIDMAEDFPATQEELLRLREQFFAKPMYVGGLFSSDGHYGAIMVEMNVSSADDTEKLMLDPQGGNELGNFYPQAPFYAIEEILTRPEYAGITFHHSGDVPLNATMNIITASETGYLAGGCLLVVGIILYFFFRSVIGVVGPLIVVALSMMFCVATIGLLGWSINSMFVMVPTLLIAVGIADSIHIVAEFQASEAELGDRRAALLRTLYLVGTPCLLTSLTTAAGFGAMSVAPIRAIGEFGVYTPIGILAAFFLSTTLLIVFLSFRKRETGVSAEDARAGAKGGDRMRSFLIAIAVFDFRHRRAILVTASVIFLVSVVGMTRLRVDSNFLNDFDADTPVRKTIELVDSVMNGPMSLSYVFDSHTDEGAKDPAFLAEIEALAAEARTHESLISKTYSINDVIKDINQTFHEGDTAYHEVPDSRDLIGQYLLLYEMSGGQETEEYLSGDFSRANIELRCRLTESSEVERLATSIAKFRETHGEADVTMTGVGALWVKLMDYITKSQIRGFLLALGAITIMMCLVFRSLSMGLIAMIPNLTPVFLTLGGMGWGDIPLDYVRMLIAPVAIGIAVDDTIHHVTRFRHEFLRTGRYEEALRLSMLDVGRALLITSVVLVLGFSVFALSMLDAQQLFGLLLGATIVMALVADFILMPALVLTFKPFGPERD